MASYKKSTNKEPSKPIYTDRGPRISKENLCMVLALWMERFQKEEDSHRNVGAVLVLPNDMLHAVDCSRHGVHGVARLLIKHHDVAKDGKVFVSRKPCSFCTKLLVQSKVKRVFYLPIEPEYKDEKKLKDETSRVDNLFKTSAISQSVFVPIVGKDVIDVAEKKRATPEKDKEPRDNIKKDLLQKYWNEDWMEKAKDDLPWPAFDSNMKQQVQDDFRETMEWMARFSIVEKKGYTFKVKSKNATPSSFDPVENDKQASYDLLTLANFLAERSDDPKTGVGAVIINKDLEILALGWNGFPTKALYGEFPRASHDDQVEDKKYPYMIHAEQNALLMRNTKNLTDGILFVTKTPCDECTPLLAMEGIKTVVLGEELKSKTSSADNLNYTEFGKKVDNGVFTCFEMTEMRVAVKRSLQSDLDQESKKSKN